MQNLFPKSATHRQQWEIRNIGEVVIGLCCKLGCLELEWIESPILGAEGNREFLLHGKIGAPARG